MWPCDPAMTSTVVDSYQVAGPLFASALQAFLAAHCALVGEHLWPVDAIDSVLEDPNFDFIVVGAGSAGAVVANRLSEVPNWKVLLIEAGGNPNLATEMPRMFGSNMKTAQDWGYTTQPDPRACRSYTTKGCAWPRGKVLGGSSSINAMFYVRGNKLDYDEWAAQGNKDWGYDDVLPFFRKSENISSPITAETSKHHSNDGYLSVKLGSDQHDLEKVLLNANAELGMTILQDINGYDQMGVTISQTTIKSGVRQSTARAFLSSIKTRPNLYVLKNALVTKILYKKDSNEVKGVLINKDGIEMHAIAKKEVIISAGSVNTPQLLLLSGIGPAKHLNEQGIKVKADLPTGENLQDHPFVPMFYTLNTKMEPASIAKVIEDLADFLINRKGPFTGMNSNRVISFINTTHFVSSSPDIQHHYFYSPPGSYNILDSFKKHGIAKGLNEKLNDMNKDKLVLTICTVLLRPKSRGRIQLKNKNPNQFPLIYANYFENPDDIKTIIKGMKYVLKLGETKTFKNIGFKLNWLDVEACRILEKEIDDFLECIAREITFSLYHPVGTAKMGPADDATSVVDSELRVRGIKRLRVIDASIMPIITRGNTNAPTIMIGEKGAELVKKDWLPLEKNMEL